ncbi:MAG: hypothetical protein AAF614_14100 [Chloroflexota bacterium]
MTAVVIITQRVATITSNGETGTIDEKVAVDDGQPIVTNRLVIVSGC